MKIFNVFSFILKPQIPQNLLLLFSKTIGKVQQTSYMFWDSRKQKQENHETHMRLEQKIRLQAAKAKINIWSLKIKWWGVHWWLRGLRMWHCHCCGMGSIPSPGNSICWRWGQKKKEKPHAHTQNPNQPNKTSVES